jgi:hypothetical protein
MLNNYQKALNGLKFLRKGPEKAEQVKKTSYLKLAPKLKLIPLKALAGKRTILGSPEIFDGKLTSPETIAALDLRVGYFGGVKTKKTILSAYKLTAEADFQTMFNSFQANFENLWLTEDQLCEFASVYLRSLSTDKSLYLFILLKVDVKKKADRGNLLVAGVNMRKEGLSCALVPFNSAMILSEKICSMVIIPQLLIA